MNMEYVLICIAVVIFLGIVLFSIISNELFNMGKPYTNKDFIDHLAEDLHSVVGIKIIDDM
jgi:hypothetical protein